jgi:nitrate reductase gamma subunit
MMVGGVVSAVAPNLLTGTVAVALAWAIKICGAVGLGLGILGAIGLILRRVGTKELRMFTTAADIFNLVFFIVAFGCAFVTFIVVDRDFAIVSAFVRNLVTFNMGALPGTGPVVVLPVLSVILLAALTAYIPLTHMSHFVGKYFAYHAIRWNDEPNLPGGRQEGTINDLLTRPVTWAAPHIQGDGKKTWADVATEEVQK